MSVIDVVGIGDSLMAANPAGPPGMGEIFAGLHTCRFSNKGIGGQTTSQISARFTTDVVNQHPLYALINGGVNDISAAVSEATFLSNWDSMLSACKSNGIFALALMIFPETSLSNAQMTTRDTWIADLVTQTNAAAYASNTLILNMDSTIGQFRAGGTGGNLWDIIPSLTPDNIHLTTAGYALVGQAIDTKFLAAGLFMVTSANTVWDVRGTGGIGPGSDNNGGGFVIGSGGTDYSQSNTPILTVADAVTTGTTTVTSVTGGFTAAMIGNNINLVGDGVYTITARASTNSITVNQNTGTSGAQTANVGGAFATLSKVAGTAIFSNKIFATGAVGGAGVTFAQTGTPTAANPPTRIMGYTSTHGDAGHASFALTGGTGQAAITLSGQGCWIEGVDVDCGSLGTSTGIVASGTQAMVRNCKVSNFTTRGINSSGAQSLVTDCEVTGGTSAATDSIEAATSGGITVQRCNVHDNACLGIKLLGLNTAMFNLVTNNSGASSDGIQTANDCIVEHNTIHNNGRDGIRATNVDRVLLAWRNNLITNNANAGITATTSTAFPADPLYDGNAYYNNGAGGTVNRVNMDSTAGIYAAAPYTNVHDVICTVTPYVGGTTGSAANFALNDNVGGGRSCRRAGSPGTWPGNTGTTGFLDFGAVQTKSNVRRPFLGF